MGDTPIPIEKQFTDAQKQQIKDLYNSGKIHREIAGQFGVSRRTITKLCARLGLHKSPSAAQKSKRDPLVEQKVISLRQSGLTLKDITEEVGLTISSINRICKKYNIVNPTSKLDDAEIKRLYESGMGQNKLVEKFGVSGAAISKSLNRSNVTRRDPIINSIFKPKKEIILPPFVDTKEWFLNAYITKHYGMGSISNFVTRSVGYVSHKLKQYGIPIRSISDGNRQYEKDYVVKVFLECKQNISLTARTIGCDSKVVREATREAGYKPVDTSIKFVGPGNPFYGQKHAEDTVELCTKIGAENGIKFWQDHPEYVEIVRQKAIQYWADPTKRLEDSVRVANLRVKGKCNSKQSVVDSRFGLINCDSSYESKFVEECENNQNVKFIEREFDIVEYEFQGNKYNYVPDFRVWFVDGDFKVIEIKSRYWQDQDLHFEAKKTAAINKFGSHYEYKLIENNHDFEKLKL